MAVGEAHGLHNAQHKVTAPVTIAAGWPSPRAASSVKWSDNSSLSGMWFGPERGTLPCIWEVLETWPFPLPPLLNCP